LRNIADVSLSTKTLHIFHSIANAHKKRVSDNPEKKELFLEELSKLKNAKINIAKTMINSELKYISMKRAP
jgi:hypothetical protein